MKIPTASFILIVIVLLAIIGHRAKAEVGDTVDQEFKRSPSFAVVEDSLVGSYRAIVRMKAARGDSMLCIFKEREIVNMTKFATPLTVNEVSAVMAVYGVKRNEVEKNVHNWRCWRAVGRDLKASISPDSRIIQFFTDEGGSALDVVAAGGT